MILVLTHHSYEQGTDPVIDWLLAQEAPFLRVSLMDLFEQNVQWTIDVARQDILIDGISIRDQISVIWYRRLLGELVLHTQFDVASVAHREQLQTEMTAEVEDLFEYFCYLLRDKVWLPDPKQLKVNKTKMLNIAQDSGLRVPNTRIVNNKPDLIRFFDECSGGIINKSISDQRTPYLVDDLTYVSVTRAVTPEHLEQWPERFFPSLFQECIARDYEIRVFYLAGTCFPTAIETPPSTHADRKLTDQADARYLPYQLPELLTRQIQTFMKAAGLNTGCLDLMCTPDGAYVFLEVNPVGQYLAESQYCNYQIDREIARWLLTQQAA